MKTTDSIHPPEFFIQKKDRTLREFAKNNSEKVKDCVIVNSSNLSAEKKR